MTNLWAVEWRSKNALDGETRSLIWVGTPRFQLFPTRRECQAHIEQHFGYIRDRPDLKREPHGWRMPRPIRVRVLTGGEK